MSLTAAELAADLRALGLPAGASVLVHSSLSRIGRVDGGAATVVAALEHVVGPDGTVLVPTFTGGPHLSPSCPPVFDPVADAGWTGAVAETVRLRPDAVRSLNPTHSVAAIGRRARELTRDHVDSVSPCDGSSPFARLAERDDGYVLLVGVDHESNSTFHHVEELVGVDYHLQREPARAVVNVGSQTLVRDVLLHRYGTPRRFMVVDELLTELGAQTVGRVGAAETRLVRARAMVSIAADALRADPLLFVDLQSRKERTWARSRSRA
jgi:aminoglycoside 3-N-acetyltransferase